MHVCVHTLCTNTRVCNHFPFSGSVITNSEIDYIDVSPRVEKSMSSRGGKRMSKHGYNCISAWKYSWIRMRTFRSSGKNWFERRSFWIFSLSARGKPVEAFDFSTISQSIKRPSSFQIDATRSAGMNKKMKVKWNQGYLEPGRIREFLCTNIMRAERLINIVVRRSLRTQTWMHAGGCGWKAST